MIRFEADSWAEEQHGLPRDRIRGLVNGNQLNRVDPPIGVVA